MILNDVIDKTECMLNKEINDVDNDGDSTCSSNDTNECIEFFLGFQKNAITLDDMKDVNYDENSYNRLDCLENNEQHSNHDDPSATNHVYMVEETSGDGGRKPLDAKGKMEMNSNNRNYGANENDDMQVILNADTGEGDCHHLLWFKNAYAMATTTSLGLQLHQQYPVRIAYDHSNQYYSLVATKVIPSGTILYTERPICATQIALSSSLHVTHINQSPPQTSPEKQVDSPTTERIQTLVAIDDHGYYKVRACQFCFRSLEPISSCYNCCTTNHKNTMPHHSEQNPSKVLLPLAHLYPIPDFRYLPDAMKDNTDAVVADKESSKVSYRKDQYGRVQCTVCLCYFCSEQCYNRMIHQYGSCCSFIQHLQYLTSHATALSSMTADESVLQSHTSCRQQISKNDGHDISDGDIRIENVMENDPDRNENDENDPIWEAMQQPAVALAVRMFVATLHHHRSTTSALLTTNTEVSTSANATDSFSFLPTIIDGLCGTAGDLQLLELGLPIRLYSNQNSNGEEMEMKLLSATVQYTVEPIFNVLVHTHSISTVEQATQFTLDYFMSLCSKAARNGFGIRPQSPFQSYYAGIVRTSMYRGSTQHVKLQNQVAKALLGCADSDAQFQRGMDRMVDDRVCPEVVALYPLTSRINHSCVPNSEVRSQQYIDSTIDVVAIKDIKVGEEITISYIYGSTNRRNTADATKQRHRGNKTTHRRQQELYAKYLFRCDCVSCQRSGP